MLDFGFYNMDCLEGMKEIPDKFFDLAICDPPYGIGYDAQAQKSAGKQYGKSKAKTKTYHTANWDTNPPGDEYFNELFRVSKSQIIWGETTFDSCHRLKALSSGINALTEL
jgi:site-specific DNA-methyltransferase (adenine-specific)